MPVTETSTFSNSAVCPPCSGFQIGAESVERRWAIAGSGVFDFFQIPGIQGGIDMAQHVGPKREGSGEFTELVQRQPMIDSHQLVRESKA